MTPGAPALTRGLAMLERIARDDRPVGFNALMQEIALPKATCARLLNVLREDGYVVRDEEQGGYILGERMALLRADASPEVRLRVAGAPILRQLRNQTSGSALLLYWDGRETLAVAKETHPDSPSMRPVGQRCREPERPPWGLLLFHLLPVAAQRQARAAMADAAAFERAYAHWLKVYKRRGYALDDCQELAGVRRFGAPVYGTAGRVVGVLGLGATTFTIPAAAVDAAGRAVVAAARKLSVAMGCRLSGASAPEPPGRPT